MIEKRQQQRIRLISGIHVYEIESGNHVGNLVDITTDGFRILNREPLKTGKKYSFKLDLKNLMDLDEEFVFDAECMWQQKEFSSGVYNSGFKIVGSTKESRGIIVLLIDKFSKELSGIEN